MIVYEKAWPPYLCVKFLVFSSFVLVSILTDQMTGLIISCDFSCRYTNSRALLLLYDDDPQCLLFIVVCWWLIVLFKRTSFNLYSSHSVGLGFKSQHRVTPTVLWWIAWGTWGVCILLMPAAFSAAHDQEPPTYLPSSRSSRPHALAFQQSVQKEH